MEWISVKDRLPEHKQSILAFGDNAIDCLTYDQGDDYFYYPYCSCCSAMFNITHWMPLPNPPDKYCEAIMKDYRDNLLKVFPWITEDSCPNSP
jgi:hypothetical protein